MTLETLRQLGTHAPWGGLAGEIFTAFIGALVLLVILRLLTFGRRRIVP